MAPDSPDLHCLNNAEREVLALLASGQTAKSIATLTGRTEGVINERLREARRKTGVGSSRELARLLRQQENWDENIGVEARRVPGARPTRPAGGHRWLILIGSAMIAMVTALCAVVFLLATPQEASQTPPSPTSDPLFDAAVRPTDNTPQTLRKQLDVEARDPMWAPKAEAALVAAYRSVDGLAPGMRIRCASTLCEVAGQSTAGSMARLNRTMQALQGQRLISTLSQAGLRSPAQSFGESSKTKFAFVAFWVSAKP
jgi:DNA-binding CsgD family transcriptional regulator